jgi:hypothetical protein
MEHIGGFMQSRYMPPLGEYLHRIGPADAMVITIAVVRKHKQNTTFS